METDGNQRDMEEWKADIRKKLESLGIRVSAEALIEPIGRFNKLTPGKSSVQRAYNPDPNPLRKTEKNDYNNPTPKKELWPTPPTPKVIYPKYVPGVSKVPVKKDINTFPPVVVNEDKTLTIPPEWTDHSRHTPENRRTVIGAKNRLRNIIDAIEKKRDPKLRYLLESHRKTLKLLTGIYL